MARFVVAIDQGTTGTTVLVFDEKLELRARGYREFQQHFPKPGWVEHDPEEIWQSVVGRARRRAARLRRDVDAAQVVAIGITNQRETTLVWERATGKPLHNAIVWQDRRTADICAELKAAGLEDEFKRATGLVLDPYFSGTKLQWLLDNVDGLRARAERGEVCFGTVDSYLVWRLTGGAAHVTDVSNASRTLLFDLHTLEWSARLCDLLKVPRAILPDVRGSSERYGETRGVPGLPDGIPVCGIAGDQQAALFGQACFAVGDAKCTYGTGAFMLMNTGERAVPSQNGLLTTVGWKLGDEVVYALEGSTFIAGAMVQWLRDGLGIIATAREIEALAASVPDSGGVVAVPALAGPGRAALAARGARHHHRADARDDQGAPGARGARGHRAADRGPARRHAGRRGRAGARRSRSTAARAPTTCSCSIRPTCSAARSCVPRWSRPRRSARRCWRASPPACGRTPATPRARGRKSAASSRRWRRRSSRSTSAAGSPRVEALALAVERA